MKTTTREIEVKLEVEDIRSLLTRLRQLGARPIRRVFERNTLFDTADNHFRQHKAILRLRREAHLAVSHKSNPTRRARDPQGGILTFKAPLGPQSSRSEKYKQRAEIEFRLKNAARFERVLRRIGMKPWFKYEKYRTRYDAPSFPGLHLDLDEAPIGIFLELEGSKRHIDRAAKALGYSKRDYITASYLELYAAECARRGVRPRNMTFPASQSKKFR